MNGVGSHTPVTDAALRDRIGVPDAVRRHLREQEQAVHRLLRQLAEIDDTQAAAARAELRSVLEDPHRSPLLRALRRRTADLEPGAPARRSLDNALGAILSRATRALRRATAAAEFRRAYDTLHARYTGPVPWHLARALEGAGITADTLERLRDAGSLQARTERMREIDAELAERVAALPRWIEEPLEVSAWPEGVSPAELAAAVQQAEREERSLTSPAWRARGRALAGEHARRLLGGGTGTAAASDTAESAAREALRLVEAGQGVGAEDLDAQGIVLRGAARARARVHAGAPASPAPGEDTPGSLLFVVPLFGPYVLVRRGRPWPVRVDDRRMGVGREVRCVASLPPESAATPRPPELLGGAALRPGGRTGGRLAADGDAGAGGALRAYRPGPLAGAGGAARSAVTSQPAALEHRPPAPRPRGALSSPRGRGRRGAYDRRRASAGARSGAVRMDDAEGAAGVRGRAAGPAAHRGHAGRA